MKSRPEVFAMIDQEREKQAQAHGYQSWFEWEWLVILMEELGEAAAVLNSEGSDNEFVREMVQVAAVAVAILEDKA
jgi:hypothetical protein